MGNSIEQLKPFVNFFAIVTATHTREVGRIQCGRPDISQYRGSFLGTHSYGHDNSTTEPPIGLRILQ